MSIEEIVEHKLDILEAELIANWGKEVVYDSNEDVTDGEDVRLDFEVESDVSPAFFVPAMIEILRDDLPWALKSGDKDSGNPTLSIIDGADKVGRTLLDLNISDVRVEVHKGATLKKEPRNFIQMYFTIKPIWS